MKSLLLTTYLMACFGFALSTFAQTPASVTATCKDGSSFSGTTRSGALCANEDETSAHQEFRLEGAEG
jgi:hypothetical protein